MSEMRHLELDELLALRDGEGTALARSHVESCRRCGRELERLYQIRARLRALPTLAPPRDLWPRVAAAVARRRTRRRFGFGVAGLAIAAALLAFVALRSGAAPEAPEQRPDAWVAEAESPDLGPFIHRSRELESLLRRYRPDSRVYNAPTALAVSVLEDRIGLLDRMLAESRAIGADREFLAGLWDERVEALETLVGLQVAQEPQRVWR
jgi:hypothetical protein